MKEIGDNVMNWTELVQVKDYLRVFLNASLNFWVPFS